MNPLLKEAINTAIIGLKLKKEKIVKEKLLQKGIIINWYQEKQRRFKNILRVEDTTNKTETYYYNDGSIEGLKIVTFETIGAYNEEALTYGVTFNIIDHE